MLIIATAYLLIFEGEIGLSLPVGVLIAVAILSNVFLSRLPETLLLHQFTSAAVILADVGWIALALWSKGESGNDIFFLYFVVLFLAAVGQNLLLIISVSVLLSLVDLVLFVAPAGEGQSIWTSHSLIRVPFMFMAALFYGYLSEQVREEKRIADKRLKALKDIDVAIISSLNFRAVLDVLLDKILAFFPDSIVTVRLLNRRTGELEAVAGRNVDEPEWQGRIPKRVRLGKILPVLNNGHGGLNGNGYIEHHPQATVGYPQTNGRSADLELIHQHESGSSLRIPLIANNELFGLLTFSDKNEGQFSDEDVQFLTALATQAAVGIHNSRLYDELKRLADDLAASNRVKEDFLSVMSHELRTPLNIVLGYAGLVKESALGQINRAQEKAVDKIVEQSKDLVAMVDAILHATSSNLESAKAEHYPVNLSQFLNDFRATCPVPVNNDVVLTWEYTDDLPSVITDADKLRIILTHLINNAIKFTPRGGIRVFARKYAETNVVEFKVSDTGIGIPEESLSLIFEKFYQVDSTNRRLYGGVGIGLYIVKKYTELLGGQVEVESKSGEGSAFSIRLPTTQPGAIAYV